MWQENNSTTDLRVDGGRIPFGIENQVSGVIEVEPGCAVLSADDGAIMTGPEPNLSYVMRTAEHKLWLLAFKHSRTTQSHDTSQRSHSLLTTNPGLSRTPRKNFPARFRSPGMFEYKEKTRSKGGKSHRHSTLSLSKQQSTQTGCYTIAACFPLEPLEKMYDFQGHFPRTLSFNFHDFLGPKWFSRTFQILEFYRKKSRTFHEAWKPWHLDSETRPINRLTRTQSAGSAPSPSAVQVPRTRFLHTSGATFSKLS